LAACTSGLCGLFLHPQGFVVFFGVLVVTALGLGWPWVSVRGLSGSLSFDRARCREGEKVTALLVLRNRVTWGTWGVSIYGKYHEPARDCGNDGAIAGLAYVAGWRTTEAEVDFVPDCRGVYPQRPSRLACGFPFGLWEASRPLDVPRPLTVWPRTFPVAPVPNAEGGSAAEGLDLRWPGSPRAGPPYRSLGRHYGWNIELAFSKLKSLLRKAGKRTMDGLWEFSGQAPDAFTPQECLTYMRHCGYTATGQ
jgi:uncharacterized protein (DUF58 family)